MVINKIHELILLGQDSEKDSDREDDENDTDYDIGELYGQQH